jgi:hypothetical protein
MHGPPIGRADERVAPRSPGRSSRRFWFDPRFALGMVLVAGSVTGVGAIVASADRSVAVYTAAGPLSVGETITASDLVSTQVRFPGADELYLTPGRLPAEGLLVTRTITKGELVAESAVGTRAGASVTSVVVDVTGTLAAAIVPGAVVDVWAARQSERAAYGPPAVLVSNASVVRLIEARSLIDDGRGQSVEILVPKTKVAAVLESIANEDSVALIPVNEGIGD